MDISDEENDVTSEEKLNCVEEMVKAILILDYTKKPFKQNDINGLLSTKPKRKFWNANFCEAKEKLKEIGLILKESKITNSKSYYLISSIVPTNTLYNYALENEIADRILLILVLTFILVKETSVSDADILKHLQLLNIYNKKEPFHTYFGDVPKKIFSDFVNQLYLEKVSAKDSDTVELKWGERANAEVTKKSILEFVNNIGYQCIIKPKNLILCHTEEREDDEDHMQE